MDEHAGGQQNTQDTRQVAMTASQTLPTTMRWFGGGSVTAPEGSIQVRTVLPLRAPATARTSPVRGGCPGGCQRAGTQVVCTDVYGLRTPVAGASSSRTAVTW